MGRASPTNASLGNEPAPAAASDLAATASAAAALRPGGVAAEGPEADGSALWGSAHGRGRPGALVAPTDPLAARAPTSRNVGRLKSQQRSGPRGGSGGR